MGPTGHIAEPQTTEEHDEVTKNAKIVLGYRLFLMRSTVFFFNYHKIASSSTPRLVARWVSSTPLKGKNSIVARLGNSFSEPML